MIEPQRRLFSVHDLIGCARKVERSAAAMTALRCTLLDVENPESALFVAQRSGRPLLMRWSVMPAVAHAAEVEIDLPQPPEAVDR